ncbi:serine/threonine-protein kinase [Spirillospora sp. CA-255316]
MSTNRLLAGRYRLVQRLGKGGMGVVWRARDETLGRDVAVKELLLPEHLSPEQREQSAQRAMREARAAALVRHKSIVTVHDVVLDEGRPCIVMDLLPGRSLDAVVAADGPLPWDRAARIGLEILGALRAAHAQGILHRDVKPANIFLRDDGRAVLTDFGIASLEGDATLTQEGSLIGSPSYMAPERVSHQPSGPASDLWSLGATLYTLVEGRPPFLMATLMGTLYAVLTDDPPSPQKAGPLGPLIMASLVKDPSLRLSADRAEQALRALASGEHTSPAIPLPLPANSPSGPPTVPSGPPQKGSATPWIIAVLASAALLVAVVVTVALLQSPDRPPPRAAASTSPSPPPTPTAPVRFASPPAPCALISAEQATQLVPSFSTTNDADVDKPSNMPRRYCSWLTNATAAGQDDSLTLTLRTAPSATGAQSHLAEDRHNATTPVTDIGDLGDGGYSHTRDTHAIVAFRLDNLLVEVDYDTRRPNASQAALRAARWTETSLTRPR